MSVATDVSLCFRESPEYIGVPDHEGLRRPVVLEPLEHCLLAGCLRIPTATLLSTAELFGGRARSEFEALPTPTVCKEHRKHPGLDFPFRLLVEINNSVISDQLVGGAVRLWSPDPVCREAITHGGSWRQIAVDGFGKCVVVAERAYVKPPAWRADYRCFEAELLDDYQAVCQLCLRPIDLKSARTSTWGATIDHIVPRARWGGSDNRENLWVAHFLCNVVKSARFIGAPKDVEAFRISLKRPYPTWLLER